ncbi:MAG: NfeD family protein [Roseiflexaceae bacterium]|jgi:membrane protein implicated in regulation of membrane protease activity
MNNGFVWATIGLILLTVEPFVPGVYALWIGIAALVTAGFAFVFPSMGVWLFLVFAFATVVSAVGGSRLYARMSKENTDLNQMQQQLIGKSGICIAHSDGAHIRIRIDGVEWAALADGEIAVDDPVVVLQFHDARPVVRRG